MKKILFLVAVFLSVTVVSFLTVSFLYEYYIKQIEENIKNKPPQNIALATAGGLTVEYSDGSLMYLPKGLYKNLDGKESYKNLSDIPGLLVKTVVVSEDRRFFDHNGVDILGLIRALTVVLLTDDIQGGSTITQQLARTLYLTTERSIERKIKEAFIAIWLEQNLSKGDILELYINSVYLGNGIYGFPAAAKYYFGKDMEDLEITEIARLVATLRSPEPGNPLKTARNTELARTVLRKMNSSGLITDDEFTKALKKLSEEVVTPHHRVTNSFDQELFWRIVLELGELGFKLEELRKGYTVRTTINRSFQNLLYRNLDPKSAGLIVDVNTGKILATYGIGVYKGKRQVGSVIKPLYYYLAFMGGWNSTDKLEDNPLKIREWEPQNFDKKFLGSVTVEQALVQSRNIPSVNLFNAIGINNVKKFLKDELLIDGFYPDNATLALGTLETSLENVAKGFMPIYNGGVVIKPTIIDYIVNKDGKKVYEYSNRYYYYSRVLRKPESIIKVVKPIKGFDKRTPIEASVMILPIMQKVLTSGTGTRAYIPGRTIYGKTGTADRNAWFVGGDGKYLMLIAKDGTDLSGGIDVAPVWKKIALETDIGLHPLTLPLDINVRKIENEVQTEKEEVESLPAQTINENYGEAATTTSIIESNLESSVTQNEFESKQTEKSPVPTPEEILEAFKSKKASPEEIANMLKELNNDMEAIRLIKEMGEYEASIEGSTERTSQVNDYYFGR